MTKSKLWKIRKGRIDRASKENIFNSFGKGCDLSVALNWSESSGRYCWRGCRHHKDSTAENPTRACYSSTAEAMRPTVRDSLERKGGLSPLYVIGTAYIQLGELFSFLDNLGLALAFFRFSAAGSVPGRDDIPDRERKRYEILFRKVCELLVSRGVKIHLPVESAEKAEYYRGIVGDIVVVRLSLQDSGAHLTESGDCSLVVGAEITSKNSKTVKRDRIALARQVAAERYSATGRKTIVCPAIVATFEKRENQIKCGDCDACARHLDVVYPLHV